MCIECVLGRQSLWLLRLQKLLFAEVEVGGFSRAQVDAVTRSARVEGLLQQSRRG